MTSFRNKILFPRNISVSGVACVSLIALVFTLKGCTLERPTVVTVEGGNPPTFKLKGSGRQDFLLVRVLSPQEIADPKIRPVETEELWELRPKGPGEQPPADDWPTITYGTVPPDFVQTIPSSGKPKPLQEGKTYEAGGSASGANGGSVWFKIENGQPKEIPKKD